MNEPYQPLAGVTVLAWEQAVSLPMATRLLGDLGATVIRVESHTRSAQRPRYLANDLARNKLSLALDLQAERGQDAFRALARKVDVVCENFTPRVKRRFGLTYDDLQKERRDLVMLSLSGYGQTGAWSERPTYGPGIEAAAGHAQSMGFPDLPPTRPGTVVYADNISGFYAAFAILAALQYRKLTRRGRYIDLSMYEANAYHLGLSIARSSLTGAPEPRRGNADPVAAIQEVLPTRDGGQWLAVTVPEARMDALRTLVDAPSREGDLVSALGAWAARRSARAAATALQAVGIAASPVLNAREVLLDDQLRHREAFTEIEHESPLNGHCHHPHGASPWRFDARPRPPLREAPAVGQDSRAVLRRWLGMAEGEIDGLIEGGVVGEPAPAPPAVVRRIKAPQLQKLMDWQLVAAVDPEPEQVLGLRRCREVEHADGSRS